MFCIFSFSLLKQQVFVIIAKKQAFNFGCIAHYFFFHVCNIIMNVKD